MSTRELQRAGVLARVVAKTLSLHAAAELMAVTYRQAKRLCRRYRQHGAAGLTHRATGRASNRQADATTRTRALALIREKYSGGVDDRFGPTLAAEHLASEDGLAVDHETLRRWMLAAGRGVGRASAVRIGGAANGKPTLANWCSSMAASIDGLKIAGRTAVYSPWSMMQRDGVSVGSVRRKPFGPR